MAEEKVYIGTGRRKRSTARVVMKKGKGKIIINDKDVNEYLPFPTLVMDLKQPLTVTKLVDKFDIEAVVKGGGFSGQSGAIRLGIARALLAYDDSLRKPLKEEGFIRRDPRKKERKKYGLNKARKAPQFSKR